jgi:hypothetical protein
MKALFRQKLVRLLNKYTAIWIESLRTYYSPQNGMNLANIDMGSVQEINNLRIVFLYEGLKKRTDIKFINTVGPIVHFIKK